MGETASLLWQTKTTQLKQLIMLLNNLHVDAQKLGYLRLYMAQLTEYDDTSSPPPPPPPPPPQTQQFNSIWYLLQRKYK